MGIAQLDNLSFRIDPTSISYGYDVDYAVIDTLGGQVIQVLGATIGDITIQGSFGQDHQNKRESWQLAESFHASIRSMIDRQVLLKQGIGRGDVHKPYRFTYMDGVHDWDFKVLIKGIADADGDGSVHHSAGKYSYGYTLTLFLVEDSSLKLRRITTDKFISRISNGLGWKRSPFNGKDTVAGAIEWITQNSTDGTFQGYLTKLVTQAADPGNVGTNPTAAPPAPPPISSKVR